MNDRVRCIADLHMQRPRSRALWWSMGALGLLGIYSWTWGLATGDLSFGDTFSARRLQNLERFLGEIRPYPLHGVEWDTGIALDWARTLMSEHGYEAMVTTLAISVVAICMAGLVGAMLALPAARTLARADAYLPTAKPATRGVRFAWAALVTVTRGLMVFLRAIPEYVWAFLLVTMLGVTAWPAVLALAIHNAGIMGRLQSEVIENVPPTTPATLRGLGATRSQVALFALMPETLNRFLLFFFSRWETCVREATILGLLGMASLGAVISESRAGQRLDEMMFFVLVGSLLVVVGDALSILARRLVREAG